MTKKPKKKHIILERPSPISPIEVYVSKIQTGYNEFQRGVIATDSLGYAGCDYPFYNSKSMREFYDCLISILEQDKGSVELHLKGSLTKFDDETRLDGYFGRRMYIVKEKFFLRNLSPPESNFLRKQFNKLNKRSSLKLILAD